MRLIPSRLAIAAILALSGAAPAFAQAGPVPPTVAPPVNVAPSQPRAIEIQPADPAAPPVAVPAAPVDPEPLPPKITLVPEVPPAPPVAAAPPAPPVEAAPPAAPADEVLAETPEQKAEKAGIRQKAYLVGAWVYDVAMPHGEYGQLRLVIRYRDDGSFAGIAQFYQGGVRTDVKIGGNWTLYPIANNRFRLDTVGDKAEASITIEMLDSHRMLNLTNNVLMRRLTL